MGKMRSNSFGGRSSKIDFKRIRRTVSEGNVQVYKLKEEILAQKDRLEEKHKKILAQKEGLKEMKLEEEKALVKQHAKAAHDIHEEIDKKIEDMIIKNASSKEEKDDLLKLMASGKDGYREEILDGIENIKEKKGENLEEFKRQKEVIENLIGQETQSAKEAIQAIKEAAGTIRGKEYYGSSEEKDGREKLIEKIIGGESLYKYKNEYKDLDKKMSQLSELTDMEVDNRESLFKAVLNQNGLRLNKEELTVVGNIYELDNSESRIAAISSLLTLKNDEEEANEKYVDQYKKLYGDVNEGIRDNDDKRRVEYLNDRFESIRLCEENLLNISVEEKGFNNMCQRNKIGLHFKAPYMSGDIRDNNLTQLYEEVKVSDNEYSKLLFDIAKYGKKKEKEFEKYFNGHKKDILKDIKNCAEYLRKKEKMENVRSGELDRLEGLLSTIRDEKEFNIKDLRVAKFMIQRAKDEMDKELEGKFKDIQGHEGDILQNIKEYTERLEGNYKLKSYKFSELKHQLADIEHTGEIDTKKLKGAVDLLKSVRNEVDEHYGKYKTFKKIENMQDKINLVQIYTDEIMNCILTVIKEKKNTINMKIYHEGLLKQELLPDMKVGKEKNFVYKYDEVIDEVKGQMAKNVNQKKTLKNRINKLEREVKDSMLTSKNFLVGIRNGITDFNTLKLKRKLGRVADVGKSTKKSFKRISKKVRKKEISRKKSMESGMSKG